MSNNWFLILSFVMIFLFVSISPTATTNGSGSDLVGYWKFDEGSGSTASDSSGYNNDGTLYGGLDTTWTTGCKSGSCLEFDGLDDYVDCGNNASLDIKDGMTIEAWIKPNGAISNYQVVINRGYSGDGDYSVNFYTGTTRLQMYVEGESFYDAAAGQLDNNWHHVVGVIKSGTNGIKLYVDGDLYLEGTNTTDLVGSSVYNLRIGFSDEDENYTKIIN